MGLKFMFVCLFVFHLFVMSCVIKYMKVVCKVLQLLSEMPAASRRSTQSHDPMLELHDFARSQEFFAHQLIFALDQVIYLLILQLTKHSIIDLCVHRLISLRSHQLHNHCFELFSMD